MVIEAHRVTAERFEGEDWMVAIEGHLVGVVVSEREARLVAGWLRGSMVGKPHVLNNGKEKRILAPLSGVTW